MPRELRSTTHGNDTETESEDGLYLPIPAESQQATPQIQHPRPQSLSILQSPLTELHPSMGSGPYATQDYPEQQHFVPASAPAPAAGDDFDRTPIVEGARLESNAHSYPQPDSHATIRQRPLKQSSSLLSPFAPRFADEQPPPSNYVFSEIPLSYSPVDGYPQQVLYADLPGSAGGMYYASPGLSPHQSPYGTYPMQMSPYISAPMYQASPSHPSHMVYTDPLPSQTQMPQYAQPPPTQYPFANHPPRSRGGSPDSIAQSHASSVSLARSHSTASSDPKASRPKIKLTHDDKRRICEIAKEYTSLRQEDIAKQYGVDRSTISKILLSAPRWTADPLPPQPSAAREPRVVGGRFPAIEERVHDWYDQELAAGRDVKDSVAREYARQTGIELGYGDRFKASTKWWDKFKERRKATGRPVLTAASAASAEALNGLQMHPQSLYPGQYYQEYPNGHMYAPSISPAASSMLLSRSHSTATLSSTSSSGNERNAVYLSTPHRGPIKSESDLLTHYTSAIELGPGQTNSPNRQRSQSSPQVLNADAGHMSPSSGKVKTQRPSSASLSRQNSYNGAASPSPRRSGLTRANSSSSNLLLSASRRANRPPSLAASAFGLTPLSQDGNWSPMPSPTTSGSSSGTGTHSRRRSEVNGAHAQAPFTSTLSLMSISPDIATSAGGIPPLTPLSPKSYMGSGEYQYAPQHMVYQQTSYNTVYPIAQNSHMHIHHSPTHAQAEQWQ